MHKKQKLNLASRIAARQILPLHPLLRPQEQFIAFRQAEEEGTLEEYFLGIRTDLPEVQRKNALAYTKLLDQISSISIERESEIIRIHLERDELEHYQNKGIIAEYEFFKKENKEQQFEKGQKILQLYEQEIKILNDYVDVVLSLDPEFKLLEQFDEKLKSPVNDDALEKLLDEDNSMILGGALLRRISPKRNGVLFDINKGLKQRLINYLAKDIVSDLQMYGEMSPDEIQKLIQDQRAFLQYVSMQEDEPQYPAFLALAYEGFDSRFFETPEYIATLWQLGEQYHRLSMKNDLDYVALIKLYEFIIGHWHRIDDSPEKVSEAADIVTLKIISHRDLGKFYQHFWEWEEAILNYKELARIAQVNDQMQDFEGALFKTINCLIDCLQYEEALAHIIAALGGRRSVWRLPQKFSLSNRMQVTLGTQLAMLLQTSNLEDDEIERLIDKAGGESGKKMINLFKSLNEDNISTGQLEELQHLITEFYGNDLENYFSKAATPDEKAIQILEPLGFFDSTVESYIVQLDQIEPITHSISPELQTLYQLHRAKLQILQRDEAGVKALERLLPAISKFPTLFGAAKEGHWHNEYLRALALVINRPEITGRKIKNIVEKAIDLQLKNYLQNYSERSAWAILQSEWENTYKALLMCVEHCVDTEKKQNILNLLWNVLLFCQNAFHKYIGKESSVIPNTTEYVKLQNQLRSKLWLYYSTLDEAPLADAKKIIEQSKKIEFPNREKQTRFAEFILAKPQENSILYHLFTKMDDRRRLLTISFRKLGHHPSGDAYDYDLNHRFDEIENFLEDQKSSKAIQWKSEGMLALLSDRELMTKVGNAFSKFIKLPLKQVSNLVQLFGENTMDSEDEPIHFYCDQLVHNFPLEMYRDYKTSDAPFGTYFRMASILYQQKSNALVHLENGIALFSGVPALPGFQNLPQTLVETTAINELFDNDQSAYSVHNFSGQNANIQELQNVLKHRPAILHFAIHGVANPDLPPESSALIMAAYSEDTSSALLTYQNVLDLDLHFVDLVVLSACNSSVGRTSKGSPVQGMAYAFLNAGVKCVVASRLEVPDAKTALIMKQFYTFLKSDKDVLTAMKNTRKYFYENGLVDEKDIASWGVWL